MILINNSQILGCVIVGLVGHYFVRSSPLFFTVKLQIVQKFGVDRIVILTAVINVGTGGAISIIDRHNLFDHDDMLTDQLPFVHLNGHHYRQDYVCKFEFIVHCSFSSYRRWGRRWA